jgi:hypothetical protein
MRGLALSNLGLYPKAVASFDKAIEINPNLGDVEKNRKTALEKQHSLQVNATVPVRNPSQEQTGSIPLVYAPFGGLALMAGIALWGGRLQPPGNNNT